MSDETPRTTVRSPPVIADASNTSGRSGGASTEGNRGNQWNTTSSYNNTRERAAIYQKTDEDWTGATPEFKCVIGMKQEK